MAVESHADENIRSVRNLVQSQCSSGAMGEPLELPHELCLHGPATGQQYCKSSS